jgi:Cof subfamily protein (haloacid dehalogenase superfamily)
MDVECCICDLDGTLLNSAMTISEENISAIRNLHDRGIMVVLATGRNDLYVKDIAHQLGISTPIISCNGGLVRCQNTGEVLYSKHLPSPTDGMIVEYCLAKKYDFTVSSYDCIYHQKDSERVAVFHQYNAKVQPAFRVPLKEIVQLDALPLGKLLKVFIWKLNASQIAEFSQLYNRDGMLTIVSSEKNGLDIMAQCTSKGEALRFFSKKYDINLAKTVVFGDNYNDISMMELVGHPIAVANAEEKVKQTAKYVTLSNNEDGVAHAIRQYILGGEWY